jgi:DNA-directed RNA polymerase subunit RPC12/RpoP
MIRFSCSSCRKLLQAEDQSAGKTVTCPGCGQHLVIPPPVRNETAFSESETNGGDLPDTPPRGKRLMAREFSKYPVARIVIILMRFVAIIAAICFPIEAILIALSGDLKPSEKKAAQEKAEREFQKRLQEQKVDAGQRKIETEKQAEARLDREFLEQERERKIWTILRLLTANTFAVILILLFAELLQVLLDISRNTQELVKAQRIGTESQDVG